MLSDFLSLFFEHNCGERFKIERLVVNCFQIFYLCSSNTTVVYEYDYHIRCELLSDFLSLFFEHNANGKSKIKRRVVNCFQIFYLCSSNTTQPSNHHNDHSCELLSDFLSLFFEHNVLRYLPFRPEVVNCFQIFYLCSSNTT